MSESNDNYSMKIRTAILWNGVTQYEVAKEYGMLPNNFNRLLHNGVRDKEKAERILGAIERVAERKKKNESRTN